MKRAIFFILVLLLLIPISFSYPETIQFKDGRTIEADIIERTSDYIKVDFQGVPITYYLDEIENVGGEDTGGVLKPVTPSTYLGLEKSASGIFDDVASSIVVITTQSAEGGVIGKRIHCRG